MKETAVQRHIADRHQADCAPLNVIQICARNSSGIDQEAFGIDAGYDNI